MCKITPLLCLLLAAICANASTQNQMHSAAAADTKGTEANPLVVKGLPTASPVVIKVLPIEQSAEQVAQDKKDREEKRAADQDTASTNRGLFWLGVLQLFVFTLQLVAFAYQSIKLNQTVKAAAVQSQDMKRSADEASRAATAMEGMAAAMRANVVEVTEAFAMQKIVFKNQLRPYVSVTFRGTLVQDVSKDFRFEIQSDIQNNGNTPAISAYTVSAMRVLPLPLPAEIDLQLPTDREEATTNVAPHKGFFIRTFLPALLTEAEVKEIKEASRKRLYIYGTTTYKDIFGESHFTNFCWSIGWNFNGAAVATNAPRHNDAS